MIKIAICDDEQLEVQILERYVTKYLKDRKIASKITIFQSGTSLQYSVMEKENYDIILCDIELKDENGIRIAKAIKQIAEETIIILVTSHIEYAMDGYEASIFRFVPKQEDKSRLQFAIRDAIEYVQIQNECIYLIENKEGIQKVAVKNILYVERQGKNVIFHLKELQQEKMRRSLNEVYESLEKEGFVYINRGTIVNISCISKILRNNVYLTDHVELEASEARVPEIRKKMNQFWGNHIQNVAAV